MISFEQEEIKLNDNQLIKYLGDFFSLIIELRIFLFFVLYQVIFCFIDLMCKQF